jgi:hypothetical protein
LLPPHLTRAAPSVTIEEVTIEQTMIEQTTMKNISRNPLFLLPVLVLVLASGLGAAANDAVNHSQGGFKDLQDSPGAP